MHIAIYNIPIMIAQKFHVPLIVWGENSASEYGYKKTQKFNSNMNKNWIKNYGATSRTDINFWKDKFLNQKRLKSMCPNEKHDIRSVFLGDYLRWDPKKSFKFAKKMDLFFLKTQKLDIIISQILIVTLYRSIII